MLNSDAGGPAVVTVCKQKLHGGRGCWQAYAVDHDADGLWLFTPAGSIFRSTDGHSDEQCSVEGGDQPGLDSLILVPDPGQHWLATWRVPERALHISIEICDWIRRGADVICFLDWELDPFRLRSGLVAVEDLDDFAEVRTAGLLSDDDAERALSAAAWAERSLRRRRAPFDERSDQRLAEAGRLGLPPLTDVPHPLDL
ncbi:hypothetical protein FOE78_10035 [Microlunatus elymi]|uniref:DUF402 domain-containing protein n=1 Tax=Microlunatus elymi TaxID=2596828 RepID=A0A516PYD8_9ACTN|nr:hypothetical protein [Microlunatus elymi]QDP96199.1 hypothetical protein FOE78_10035 [Microlunatus elymi]